MIDDIVEMILKEARRRKEKSASERLYKVWIEFSGEIGTILENLREEERRKEENENEGGN